VRELRLALAEIERPGRTLVLAERRAAFLADKWDVYAQLALTEQSRGRPAAAFEASERLRAREQLELLTHGRVRTPVPAAAQLVAREQDLRRRIGELTSVLEDASRGDDARRGPDLPVAAGPTHEALLRAQDAYAELLLEIREFEPRHAALIAEDPPTWAAVARRLAPEEAFVEYLVSDSGSLAFVVTAETLAVFDLGVNRRALSRQVEFARGTLEPVRSSAADSLWRAPLRRLHRYLIAPIEESGILARKARLVLAPHGELHYLPFAALLGGEERERFVVQRYELAVTPSAAVWLALGDRPRQRPNSGVLAMAPLPGPLPATRREVEAIGERAAGALVLTGAEATEGAFRSLAPERRVLHLATYGVLNRHNPLFSFLELAPGGQHDGRLEVHEVFGLHLGADLVVLSACQTALASGRLADVPAGDDWVGLTRAFLHAGARQVAATLWPVEDWATSGLMERFYHAYTGGDDPARALAVAQRAQLAEPATSHPFRWAGFVVAGGAR
jgi:CHAT domain-containing protein